MNDYTTGERPAEAATALISNIAGHCPQVAAATMQLLMVLTKTVLRLDAFEESYLRPFGLSRSKLFVLLWLRTAHEQGQQGLAPSMLSEQLHLSRATVSSLLGSLEAQGYIARSLDPGDKRRFVIGLTASGATMAQQCASHFLTGFQSVVQSLDTPPCHMLIAGLQQLQQALVIHTPPGGE